MNEQFKCTYCGKSYRRESTLVAHLCEKRRRAEQEKDPAVQIGYQAYIKFQEMTQPGTKQKTYIEFMDSSYYLGFVRFGRYIKSINALKPEKFIEYVIRERKKLDLWCKDKTYEEYLHYVLRKENPIDTLQRGFEIMIEWADTHGGEFNHYFRYASANKICYSIISGRLSPWIVYNCSTGLEFLDKLNEDQLKLVYSYIDPEYWKKRFSNYSSDTDYIKSTLKEAGL